MHPFPTVFQVCPESGHPVEHRVDINQTKETIMSELRENAKEICKKHGITMKVSSPKYGPVEWDKDYDHYRFPVTLRKDGKSMRVLFTQSRAQGSTPPDEYDIITCITKSDPGSFEDFCAEFGYDSDSRSAERIYKAVKREWENVLRVFGEGECLDDLREIV